MMRHARKKLIRVDGLAPPNARRTDTGHTEMWGRRRRRSRGAHTVKSRSGVSRGSTWSQCHDLKWNSDAAF